MANNIRIDTKTGETYQVLPNGKEFLLPPDAIPFISEKKRPKTGMRADL